MINRVAVSNTQKKPSLGRESKKNGRELVNGIEKLVADRIDSWTKMYSADRLVSQVPLIPEDIDSFPDESTLIDWGSSLDFAKLINNLPSD